MSPTLCTRRSFLKRGLIGGALATTLPAFLDRTLLRVDAAEAAMLTQRPHGKDAPILIVMQLAGGNDGLNSFIPLENDHYRRARPRLGLVEKTALNLEGNLGLHENLDGLKALYDDGLLSLVQGVGYPNPNRSHFRATEIWHSARPEADPGSNGWLGRYFDNQCQGMAPETGISLTNQPPQAFDGEGSMGITFRNPQKFDFDDDIDIMSGASINMPGPGRRVDLDDPLAFLERSHLDAVVSSDHLHDVLKKQAAPGGFPKNKLGNDLSLVARMIAGGMSTRVYYVSQGGYDTHANQVGSHARLMRELGDSLKSFWAEMKRQGNEERVCMLVFSEFGRRVSENSSGGTDHGAAAPAMVLGGGFKGGVHGSLPDLAPEKLFRGDLQHNLDFRQLYATVLREHMSVNPKGILEKDWKSLKI